MPAKRPFGLIAGSGRKGESRRLDQVVSLRTDALLLAEIHSLAAADGIPYTEWMRRALSAAVFERQRPAHLPGYRHVGWQCEHVTLTAGAELGKASCGGGCEMQPLYGVAA